MTKLDALIEEARRLPASDRLRLLAELERSLERDQAARVPSSSYAPLIALAGIAPSDFTDVSTDKYRHLASAIAPRPGDE